ncbi:MAG: hypothetical protein V1774_10435 [Candidatus Eisenbacteria bacterium]
MSRSSLLVLLLIGSMGVSCPVHAGASDMGSYTYAATSPDSTCVVWLSDISIPEIPLTVIEPRRGMSYAERLAIMADDMRLPLMIKIRETQSAPDARRQCLWVGGRVEPPDGDLDGRFIWPSDQRLCANFPDGTIICADSVFALPCGDALDLLEPMRISPRRDGWTSSFRSIEVKHTLGEVTNTRCHIFVVFRAGEFVRRRLAWTDCTGISICRDGAQASAVSP